VTTVSSGQTVVISAGQTSSGIIVLSGGLLDVLSGGTVINAVDSGNMNVQSGGTGRDTVTHSGELGMGGEVVLSGGAEIGATVSTFGGLTVSSGGIADEVTVLNAVAFVDFGTASRTIVSSGDGFVSSGGSAVSTTINGRGQDIFSGGVATGTIVGSGGGSESVDGGTPSGTIVSLGGAQQVAFGGLAVNTILLSAGIGYVFSGGRETGATVSGGWLFVDGGTVSNTVIDSGGRDTVSSGGADLAALISGGTQDVLGTVSGATTYKPRPAFALPSQQAGSHPP
jgi:autotransporter passenger strand-loop-strand repeat protein